MAIAVQADRLVFDAEATLDAGKRLLRHRLPRIEQVVRNEVAGEEKSARIVAEGLRRERFAMLELLRRAHGVDAADEAADPFQRLRVVELRRAAAAARIYRDANVVEAQRMRRPDDRNPAFRELAREL